MLVLANLYRFLWSRGDGWRSLAARVTRLVIIDLAPSDGRV